MRHNVKWLLFLAVVVALFFWKILFTSQFSIIIGWEGANQAYAWYAYAVRTIQKGIFPAWNPYTLSGHTFLGEPQTSVFYPFKLLMYLWPLGESGILSPRLFHESFVLAHLLGAWFMFFLAKELGIKNSFAAFVAAACFTFGGFFGRLGWVNLADSAVWLPLIFLFLLRALHAETNAKRILNACFSGLCMAMAILAGSLHIPLMDVLVVVSAALFFAFQPSTDPAAHDALRSRLRWSVTIVLVVGVVSFAAASLQLFPSLEYAPLARRWTGEWSGLFRQRIPYKVTSEIYNLGPRSLFAFLFGSANLGSGEFSTYFGVMPLLLTVIGVWQHWGKVWVRYLAGLGVLAFFYALGSFSFLHGLVYLLVPYMDKAWEAGRFLYLTHFAMAVLAGFGVQSLFSGEARLQEPFSRLNRVLQWIVIVVLLTLGIPTMLGRPEINEWFYVSLLFVICSWATFLYIIRGNRTGLARFILFAVIICDLSVLTWNQGLLEKMAEQKKGTDYLEQMMSMRPVVDFLQSQAGLFRIDLEGENYPSSMGDVFGIQTTGGWGASMLDDYLPVKWSPNGSCLLNVRYVVGNRKDRPESPVFTSGQWKVYEKPSNCPRAWVVRNVVVEPSHEKLVKRIQEGGFDPLQVAFVGERPEVALEGGSADSSQITFHHYQEDRFDLTVKTSSPGLLVLSEVFYPGWEATVNGQPAHIYKVDGLLRGLIVSSGENRIVLRYRPRWFLAGVLLTALAVAGTSIFAALVWRGEKAAKHA